MNSVSRNFLRWGSSLSLAALLAAQACAQYGGSPSGSGTPGYSAPSGGYGNGKAIGVGVGAAAGAGLLFYALHHRGSVSGCIVSKDDQVSLVDKKNHAYLILPGAVSVKPGERLELRGRKSKDEAGTPTFEATKLVKRLGTCGGEPTVASAQPVSR